MEILDYNLQKTVIFNWTMRNDAHVYMGNWHMTQDEWDAMTPEDIENRQKEEFSKWYEHMINPGS